MSFEFGHVDVTVDGDDLSATGGSRCGGQNV